MGFDKRFFWLLSDTLFDGTSSLGPFEVAHGFGHCTIQVSPDTIVVTGGVSPEDGTGQDYVTSYKLTDGSETIFRRGLIQGRAYHACGAYHDAGGQQVSTVNLRKKLLSVRRHTSLIVYAQVLLVTGGSSSVNSGVTLSTTEVKK